MSWLKMLAKYRVLTPLFCLDLQADEQRLAAASHEYERVVLWLEHDRYDQFVLLRWPAWFAEHDVRQNWN